jgi:hypothetical protein
MTPAVCAVAALAYLAAGLAGDEPAFAWGGFTVMVLFGAGLMLAGRYSETAKALLDRRDERINALDRDATVITGVLLIVVILAMAIIETARGEDGSPYFALAGFAGLTYVIAFLWLRWRR